MLISIIVIIFGIILSLIFYVLFFDIVKLKGPNSENIKKNTYQIDGMCYKLYPVLYNCSTFNNV